MANRCLLHRTKQTEFEQWLAAQGWVFHEPKRLAMEAIRAQDKEGRWLIVYDRLRGDHLSLRDKDFRIFREFLNEKRGEL